MFASLTNQRWTSKYQADGPFLTGQCAYLNWLWVLSGVLVSKNTGGMYLLKEDMGLSKKFVRYNRDETMQMESMPIPNDINVCSFKCTLSSSAEQADT